MLRPYGLTDRRRQGENICENEEAASGITKTKDRLPLDARPKKHDLLLKDKNVNQAFRKSLQDKGKIKASIPSTPSKPTSTKVPLKRFGQALEQPVTKRAQPLAKHNQNEIEFGFEHEQENEYVPDGIAGLDFDAFDSHVSMDAFDSIGHQQLDTPLHHLESFAPTTRQFQAKKSKSKKPMLQARELNIPSSSPLPQRQITDDNKENIPALPDTIEYAPEPERELPDEPVASLDLSLFSSTPLFSLGDALIGDEEWPWPDFYQEEDLLDLDPVQIASAMEDAGLTSADFLALLAPEEENDAQDDDFSAIPFVDHVLPELPAISV
ncbi:hypothetical protein DM01DRAFT_1335451 [Hesseltinella vesiculosa]|uniref:Securin n=1 Tax=Hesseltinella vesiculosa TaxID=101127 RepID=A0A1X2GJK7_9FUNG|nr:hypothetical protein DM01DRAFT_1335451 [Hesseltinella vesiculosa]